jgi:hypothetical protein
LLTSPAARISAHTARTASTAAHWSSRARTQGGIGRRPGPGSTAAGVSRTFTVGTAELLTIKKR